MNQLSNIKPINKESNNNNYIVNLIPKQNSQKNLSHEEISEQQFLKNNILTCKVLQTKNEPIRRRLELKDYVITSVQKLCPQINSFIDRIVIKKSQLLQQEQETSVFQAQELVKIIMENLDDVINLQSKIQSITDGLAQTNSILLELTLMEYQELKEQRSREYQDYILELLRGQIILQNNEFWNNNNFLLQKYKVEIESLFKCTEIYDDQLLVLIKGKEIKTEDYLIKLEKEQIIQNSVLKLVGHCGQQLKTYEPLYEYSILSNQEMIDCILQLNSLERKPNYTALKQKLMPFFGEGNSLQTFDQLNSIIEHAKQIIKWEENIKQQLLKAVLQDSQNQSKLTQSFIMQKSDANLDYVRQTLEACYQLLQPIFRDEFYNFKKENEIENYIEKPPLFLPFSYTSGHCAYEVFPQGLIVYFKFKLGQGIERSCCSMLHYHIPDNIYKKSKFNPQTLFLKEEGDLGQLILSDIEEGKTVTKYQFVLRKKYYYAIETYLKENQKPSKTQNLILEQFLIQFSVLVRIISVKTKGLIINPNTRQEKQIIFYNI